MEGYPYRPSSAAKAKNNECETWSHAIKAKSSCKGQPTHHAPVLRSLGEAGTRIESILLRKLLVRLFLSGFGGLGLGLGRSCCGGRRLWCVGGLNKGETEIH